MPMMENPLLLMGGDLKFYLNFFLDSQNSRGPTGSVTRGCISYSLFSVDFTGISPIETSYCPAVNCLPGFYRSYEKVTHGFSWICIPCAKNHFKPDAGNHKCTQCLGRLSIENSDRTACVDPYTNIFVDYQSKEFLIIGSASLVAVLMVIATLIAFILNRSTPIVMTSDFKVSTLHLSIHITTIVVTPFTFIANKSCITKSLVFTTLYTLNIGIVFIKSQKLLQAFLSKVRITAEEAKRTMITQIFTVLVFLMCVNAVLLVCIYQQPVKVFEFEDPIKMTREQVCSTYFHNTMVMIAIAVIQLMCAVQAFRGRNLPSVMNDGVILMYATLILTASFAVCFIIVPFQKPIEKEISQCVALLVNTMIIMLLLYGQKAYRMLYYPEQNTRAYFRSQRMEAMKQNVNQRIEMK